MPEERPVKTRTLGQRIYSQHHTTPASRAAERVAIHLERGCPEMAHEVINDFEREWRESQRPSIGKLLETPIAQLKMQVRNVNYLEGAGVLTVDDLAKGGWTRERLLAIPNFGPAAMFELEKALGAIGLPGFFRQEEEGPEEEPLTG